MAHSQNTETDPVRRGKWIREKLLAGYVPDVPITVDAQIRSSPNPARAADGVTSKQECWKCHVHMNPLGLFEMFDDFGRFRIAEALGTPIMSSPKETERRRRMFTRPSHSMSLVFSMEQAWPDWMAK